jgi:2-polyprenyl-3-methyl-5-hydroxy-6-metoxy-1,4-benzoquinol methylase
MLRIGGRTVQQVLLEINQLYGEGVCDYRGMVIGKEHVTNYFLDSYHRCQELINYISRIGVGKKVLDIGMGYGFYATVLKEVFGLDVVGMEVERNIPAYSLLPKLHGIPIIPGELSKKPCPIGDNSYDVVIFAEVIEHLRISPLRALLEINRILKPGGLLLLTTPNMARLPNVLKLLVGKNIISMFPDDDTELAHITDKMQHIREYTISELKMLMKRASYTITKAKHSLSNDMVTPRQKPGWRLKLIRLLLLPILIIIPTLRSSILIIAQKAE